jgi:hypothetical protein
MDLRMAYKVDVQGRHETLKHLPPLFAAGTTMF